MEDDFEIRDLIIMEHYGIISPEDKLKLDAILAISKEACALQAEIKAAVPQQKAQEFMKTADKQKAHALIFAKDTYKARTSLKRRRRWLAAAALVAGVAIGSYMMFGSQYTGSAKADIAGAAILQLANGQRIVLQDSGQQTITNGQVQLSNTNRVLQFHPAKDKGMAEGWNTLIVPSRLDYQVELSDGSIVWLNSTSKMRFPFNFEQGKREVYLEGEAYFEVAADPQRPFTVHVNSTNVQVLGTSFNVNAYYPDRLITSLITGKVALEAGQERIMLLPGKEAIVRNGTESRVQDFDAQITLGWKQGIHYFQDASMQEIADMIPRWFNERIIIDDPKAGEATFRIKIYRHQPLKEFITQVNATGSVVLYYKDGVLHCKSV